MLLHPGPDSETAYEQALLSSLLGIALVRGSELTVRGGRLWQHVARRARSRRRRAAPARRAAGAIRWTCAPTPILGVPGLVEAARVGTVSVLNGLGSEVLENPGLAPFLPALCRALLGEDLRLPRAADVVVRGSDRPARTSSPTSHELVVAPIARDIAEPVARRRAHQRREREQLAARIAAEPHLWTGRIAPLLSTAPVVDGDGRRRPPGRGAGVRGGVRDRAGRCSTAGSAWSRSPAEVLAKDVWIVGEPAVPRPELLAPSIAPSTPPLSPRVADDLFWLGRYAERAESTARLLRAVDDRWADVDRVAGPRGADRDAGAAARRHRGDGHGPRVRLAGPPGERDGGRAARAAPRPRTGPAPSPTPCTA